MTVQMNIAQAKAKLSELMARAEAGEEVVIARDGKPVVSLTPKAPRGSGGRRKVGIWRHLHLDVGDAVFFNPDHEIDAAMESPVFPDE